MPAKPSTKDQRSKLETATKGLQTPVKKKEREYICTSCGKEYTKQKENFYKSRSPFFRANDYFMPICKYCIESYYMQYQQDIGISEEEALKRIALHWDLYYSQSLLDASSKLSGTGNIARVSGYIKTANLSQYRDKTFDTYLDQVAAEEKAVSIEDLNNNNIKLDISPDTIQFFGFGYMEEDYIWLDSQYKDWISRHECKTKAQEELFKNLSIIQLQIQKQGSTGKNYDKLISSYNALLTSANIKPTQTQDNVLTDQNTFGTLIQKWEENDPIPEPSEEFKDPDGIRTYIGTWFFGHLCKMFGINNEYSDLYEREINKHTVQPPEYIEDEENNIDDMLSKVRSSNGDDTDDV